MVIILGQKAIGVHRKYLCVPRMDGFGATRGRVINESELSSEM